MPRESLLLHAGEETIHSNEIVLKTRKDKFRNWWHYSRFIILGIVVVVTLVTVMIVNILSQKGPDYKILLMTHEQYPMEVVTAMQTFLTGVADDRNGDGEVTVQLDNYVLFVDEKNNGNYAYDMFEAARARYASDALYGESMIYFYDSASFGALYEDQMFIYNDGSTPPPGAKDFANMMLPIADCRLFSEDFDFHIQNAMYGMDYSEEFIRGLFEPLYISFRCTADTIWEDDEEQMAYYYDSWDLYRTIIDGRPEEAPAPPASSDGNVSAVISSSAGSQNKE